MRSKEKWGLNKEGEATETLNEENNTTYDTLWTILPDNEEKAEWQESWGEPPRSNVLALDQEQVEEKRPERHRDIQPDDLLSVYLAEMSQEPLLTFEQEVELARQIEKGHLAQQTLQRENCTADEYTRLQGLIEAGQAAREHLGRANTRLVISIAKRYRGYGIPFSDLIQNGNVGLMRAVDRYNHRSGNRFSTYATWWIRQAVTRSLANQGRVIRIPVHMGSRMREMAQIAQRLEVEHRRQPTPEEIAEAMNESPAKIRQMIRWSSLPLSLDQPVGEDGDADLGEFIEDDNILLPDDLADAQLLNETLDALLNSLTAREARILRLRYGLLDGQTRTLHQVAVKFGLSRERIRQIEREALAKLRLVAPKHRLEHFLTVN
ncbi:MAG: sigma-70 family RNA polymerase sigma factor [Anaerolineae bacterium]|jgi:RNA polymerase primary sigma factor